MTYINTVPSSVREEVADKISKMKLRSYEDISDVSKELLVELLRGNISPEIASSARSLLEASFTSIAASGKSNGGGGAFVELIKAMREEAPAPSPAPFAVIEVVDKKATG